MNPINKILGKKILIVDEISKNLYKITDSDEGDLIDSKGNIKTFKTKKAAYEHIEIISGYFVVDENR